MDKLDSYHLPVTGRNILRFAFPTIVMTVFNTFYTMVDGLFVSNLIGMEALSAINLTAPAIALITAISGMLATGGSAVVMKKMGEHREQEARQDFTLLILTNAVVGAVMMLLGYTLMDTLLGTMGLSPAVFGYCHTYLSNYLLFTIPILLMYNFSLYLIAADKSTLSLICTVAGGVTNIILDYALISLFNMGIQGAAIATGLGYSITAVVGFLVFRKKENLLHFEKPVFRGSVLFHASTNGMSELATSLVSGITTLLFNLAMLKYIGEDGVAAITIIMYVLMFVSALFIGYSYGVAPMISYYHGEKNHEKLKKLVGFSVKFIVGASVLCTVVSILATVPLVGIFTRPDSPVYELAVTGNRLCSIALLFCVVIAAPVFSADYQSGADDILRCTRHGRAKLGVAKLLAALFISAAAFVICAVVHILVVNSLFGWECTKTSIQMLYSIVTLTDMNIGELQRLFAVAGLLSVLASVSFTLFLSSRSKTTVASLASGLVFCIAPVVLSMTVPGALSTWLCSILPASGTSIQASILYAITDFKFLSLGGLAVWTPYAMIGACIIEIPLFAFLAVRSYCRHTVN